MTIARGSLPIALVALSGMVLSGCSSMGSSRSAQAAAPEQLQPVQNSTVASTALPPIGANGQPMQISGGVAAGGAPAPLTPAPTLTGQPGATPDPALTGQPGTAPMTTASTDGSFVTLDAVGSVPTAPGRDLTGGLTEAKLLGGWTIVSGATQCRLNLTQTAKDGTSRYRASTPGCQLQGLASVASWQLAGSQVQLFDESGNMVAAMILSGNRFIGTLAGGQGISMIG